MKFEIYCINFNLSFDILEVIDVFVAMNDRFCTYVIEELLKFSIPALRQLLKFFDDLKIMSDADCLTALAKFTHVEDKLTNNARNMPKHLEGISK